jgi:ABC-2 type transport system permease protein
MCVLVIASAGITLYTNKNYNLADSLDLIGFMQVENGLVSEGDPHIVIRDIRGYVKSFYIAGEFAKLKNVQIFYTENKGEAFSEEKSIRVTPKIEEGKAYFDLEKNIRDLRIDPTDEAGVFFNIKNIYLKFDKMHFDVYTFLKITSVFICIAAIITLLVISNHLKSYLVGLEKYKYLLIDLVVRDVKVKYRRSVLGFFWSILNPLLMMLVITAVFSNIFKFDIKNFPVYYMTGILIFNFVAEATSLSLTSIIGAAGLIKKVYIPKYIFPLQKCVFAFVNMIFSLVAVIIIYVILQVPLHLTLLLFWVPMLYATVFSFGLGLILASANVFFRDVGHLYSVWITAWMYLTPIIYPESILPRMVKNILIFNPMYHYVTYIRNIMIYGVLPSFSDNFICIGLAVLFFGIGIALFKKTQDRFILYI